MGGCRHTGFLLTGFSLHLIAGSAAARAAAPIQNDDCLICHSDREFTKTNAAGRVVALFVDEAKFKSSAHRGVLCADCHHDLTTDHPDDGKAVQAVACAACHKRQADSFDASVHGLAQKAGQAAVPGCVDCHGTHEILPPNSPVSPLHFTRLTATCGECHEPAVNDLAASVHGKAAAAGARDAPTCTDCHSEHKIAALGAGASRKVSVEICSRCHASARLNTKYNLPGDRVKTFFESYHGLAAQYGSTVAASCGSCHGHHKVLPSSDPASTIHQNNLTATCGQCHPGANEKFALSKVHVDLTAANSGPDVGSWINWWVRRMYLVLIVGVIGSMLIHNGLVFLKKVRARLGAGGRPVLRMSLSQRRQHAVLGISFTVLAITGFALKFPDSWLAKLMGSSEPIRRWAHRIAGIVLLLVGVYHIIYLLSTKDGRRLVKDLFPIKKDLADVWGAMRYLVGLSPEKPKIERFGYAEKMEYWAVLWGTIIMGATGLMVWFKMDITQWLPRWAVDVALTIHYYEAILACLAIVVWHFYHVMFDPDVYQLNLACWDGKVSKQWQEEEHPLDAVVTENQALARPASQPHDQS